MSDQIDTDESSEVNVTVHYNGEKFRLDRDPFGGHDLSEPGTFKVHLGDGRWLTFATGPGIPIVVEESPKQPSSRERARGKSRAVIL